MFRQRALEIFFVFCRMIIGYGVMVAFLAAPPVISLSQDIARGVQPFFPDLSIEEHLQLSTRQRATLEASRIIWLGKSADTSFTAEEQKHLLDVHSLFAWGSFLVGCAVVMSILSEKEVIDRRVARDSKRVAAGLVVVSLVVLLSFSSTFELFHQVMFPQGNYSFSPDSLIIQCFPPVFWLLNFVWLQLGVVALLWWQACHAELLSI